MLVSRWHWAEARHRILLMNMIRCSLVSFDEAEVEDASRQDADYDVMSSSVQRPLLSRGEDSRQCLCAAGPLPRPTLRLGELLQL